MSTTDAEEVVAAYWERAYRFAAMVTRNNQDSADVAQEAMIVVLRRLDQYDPEKGEFDSWLWRIVLNVARDAGRASVRRASLFERLVSTHRASVPADVEGFVVRRATDDQLLDAVRKLRPRLRTLIGLRFGAQLTYSEVAGHLGISEAAAVMATRRALAKLRSHLQEAQ